MADPERLLYAENGTHSMHDATIPPPLCQDRRAPQHQRYSSVTRMAHRPHSYLGMLPGSGHTPHYGAMNIYPHLLATAHGAYSSLVSMPTTSLRPVLCLFSSLPLERPHFLHLFRAPFTERARCYSQSARAKVSRQLHLT